LHRPDDQRRLGLGQNLPFDRHQSNDHIPTALLETDRQHDAEARKPGKRNGPCARADRVAFRQRRRCRQAANAHEAVADQRVLRADLDRQRAPRCRLGQHDGGDVQEEFLLLGLHLRAHVQVLRTRNEHGYGRERRKRYTARYLSTPLLRTRYGGRRPILEQALLPLTQRSPPSRRSSSSSPEFWRPGSTHND
jgi:hypothetical protein